MHLNLLTLFSAATDEGGILPGNPARGALTEGAQPGQLSINFAEQLSGLTAKQGVKGENAEGLPILPEGAERILPTRTGLSLSAASVLTPKMLAEGAELPADIELSAEAAIPATRFAATGKLLPVLPETAVAALPEGKEAALVAEATLPVEVAPIAGEEAQAEPSTEGDAATLITTSDSEGSEEEAAAVPADAETAALLRQPAIPVALAQAPVAVTAAASQDKPVAAEGEGEEAPSTQPQSNGARMAPPSPAEQDARRTAAPAAVTWDVAEKLIQTPQGQQARVARGEATANPAQALGEVAIETLGGERSAGRGDARGEGRGEGRSEGQGSALSTANRLAAAQSQQQGNFAQLAQGDGAVRSTDSAASSFIGDTSFASRASATTVNAPASNQNGVQDVDLAQLVDRLVESRVQARADRNQIELNHQDFGRVTLALGLQKDDRLSIDLPNAPSELRQAVGQAISAASRSEGASNNTNNNSGNNNGNGNNTGSSSNSATQSDTGSQADRQPGEARDNARQQDNRRGEAQAQQRSARNGSNTNSETASGAADENRRGVLA